MAAWRKLAITAGCIAFAFLAPLAAQEAVDVPTIKSWINQLDADRFDAREEAAAKLLSAGAAVIDPLREAIRGASREKLSRCLSILVNISLKGEAAAQSQAEEAVEAIATGGDARAARIATGSLETIHLAQRDQAREILVALGATVGDLRREDINGKWRLNEDVGTVEIGPSFRGTVNDLKQLRRLSDVQSITLSLPAANDEWLMTIIAKMPQLREVNIKRAKVTSASLAKLKELRRLHHVWICYLPVDEKGAAELGQLPVINFLTLFGASLSPNTEKDLLAALPNSHVDIRSGAFLGLGGIDGAFGFRVSSVSPGSAAEKAGIKVEDTIQTVNGKPVSSIDDLTDILRPMEAGAKVQVEYLSNAEPKKIEITLGEWP